MTKSINQLIFYDLLVNFNGMSNSLGLRPEIRESLSLYVHISIFGIIS